MVYDPLLKLLKDPQGGDPHRRSEPHERASKRLEVLSTRRDLDVHSREDLSKIFAGWLLSNKMCYNLMPRKSAVFFFFNGCISLN